MIEPPATPPYTSDLEGVGGVVKATPETFMVEEIPSYEPSGEGSHIYLWVEKRGVSAGQLIEVVAKKLGVDRNDIGAAGNKDRQAVTRQWLSVPDSVGDVAVGPLVEGIDVLEVSQHTNKLRTGHLRGNRFQLEILELEVAQDEALRRASAILERLEARGFPNYFGEQRFGRGGSTLRMGLELLSGKMPTPLRKNKRLKRLAASAAQSAVFNLVVQRRIAQNLTHTALLGDRLNRTTERGQLLVTRENLAEAQAGLDDGTLAVTGPIWGPKMYEVTDDALALEMDALAAFDLTPSAFERDKRLTAGTRRDLFARFLEPPHHDAIPNGLRVGFSLPSGAYATVVLAELTKLDFSAWEAP